MQHAAVTRSASLVPAKPVEIDAASARAGQWWLAGMGIDRALPLAKGEGVKVCLVDSGVKATHPDLVGTRFEFGKDFSYDGSPDGLTALNKHGTSMAVNIVGKGSGPGRAQGLLGAAPAATLISVSVGHEGKFVPDSRQIDHGIRYCADQGAKVISVSIAGGGPRRREALAYAQSKDAVVLVGIGNHGSDTGGSWPRAFGVLRVAGVDAALTLDPFSNSGGLRRNARGKVTEPGVSVCGPYSTVGTPQRGLPQADTGGGHRLEVGTSVATSVIAGIVAGVRSKHPDLDAANVINRILKTAKKAGVGEAPTPQCGWGVPDAYAAMTADVPRVEENPLGRLEAGLRSTDLRGINGVASMGVWDPTFRSQPLPEWTSKPWPSWHSSAPSLPELSASPVNGPAVPHQVWISGALLIAALLAGGGWWHHRARRPRPSGPPPEKPDTDKGP